MDLRTADNVRRLPHNAQTRDELIALISEKGSLSEAEVLAHINKSAKSLWTHEDFVNFFQKSCQMVFEVRAGRVYAADDPSDESDEHSLLRGPEKKPSKTCTECKRSLAQRAAYENEIKTTKCLCDNLTHNIETMKDRRNAERAVDNGARDSDSGDTIFSIDKRSAEAHKVELPLSAKKTTRSDDSDDDGNASSSRYGAGARTKQTPNARKSGPGFSRRPGVHARPLESDSEDEGDTRRITTKEEVYRLVHPRRTYLSRTEVDKMITMDPDPKNSIVPRINLDSTDEESNPDDNSSDDESSADNEPLSNYSQHAPVKPTVKEEPADEPRVSRDTQSKTRKEPMIAKDHKARNFYANKTQNNDSLANFFAVKEERDFVESRQRDPEKVLRDVMRYGKISKTDAETYLEYFITLQGSETDCLSNGQLVAGTLVLVQSDTDKSMLEQLQAPDDC